MIRLTLAALAVTIALPALANGDWPDEPEKPVKEQPVKPEPEPGKPEPEKPEPPGCPDCENPPKPQPEPETTAEPRDRFTPQASDRDKAARVPPCCTRDGVTVTKRTLFGIGQGKAIAYCAKVDPATIPVCDVKVTK